MQCPHCQHVNNETAKFCEECGTRLVRTCPACEHEVSPTAKFCPECGTPLVGQSSVQRLESSAQKTMDAEPGLSDPRRQTLDARPVSYTPQHLAERILAEQAAMETRGSAD